MRLIDADALKTKAFGKRGGLLHTSEIDEAPTVDAVEVVKCRDCRYWKTGEGVNRSKKVKLCTYAIYHSYARRDEDFCSRGERKDGDHEKAD